MYHLRVEDAIETFEMNQDPAQQMALRALTASSLYSDNLSGLIVLLDKTEFDKYARGLTANRGK